MSTHQEVIASSGLNRARALCGARSWRIDGIYWRNRGQYICVRKDRARILADGHCYRRICLVEKSLERHH